MRRAAILVAFLATGALSVPTGERSEGRCAKTCDAPVGDGAHVTFEAGKTHVYDYSSDVETTMAGATDEASRLHVTATAEITANTPCDLTLQLRDVSLQDSDPKDATDRQDVDNMASFKEELERLPIHFSYKYSGVVQLCANPADPVWVLNFKRSVLSTLITADDMAPETTPRLREEDVSGTCYVDYNISKHGDSLLVKKEKDLLACRNRGHLISSLQGTPYMSSAKVQSLPLIKSSLQCDQKVSEDRLLSSVCRESHLFKPFSQGENGAITRTTVRMTERTVRSAGTWWWQGEEERTPTVVTTLRFDHTDAELTQRNRVPAAAGLLTELQEKTSDNVRPEVPRLFTRLVSMLRHFNEEGLIQLNAQVKAGSAAQRYFVDALPLAGTAPALAMMREMILRGRVNEETTDRWMTSLAFVHEPSLEMVGAVAPLLEDRNARRQTLLGVSSMVHHYCKLSADCAEEAAVRSVLVQLERALGSGCHAISEDDEMKILTALKALGNAGRLADGISTLRTCFQDEDNSMEVRLAAIRAFRRMPCRAIDKSDLMSTFANAREDTEVRIAAYLAVMQCPTHDIVDKMQEILSAETVNQVSSFVWSHLTNMQESGDPNKSYMKLLLYNVDLAKKFNTDMRKFSRYFEKTLFSEAMNAGATVDANVVFTPDSYMPKSGMFNLTVDLFGEAFNLLEIGGRVEGLEDFSESLFGETGIYPQETLSQILKTMRGSQENALSSGRIQSPKASAYMKIFGNELRFGKYDSLKELVASMGAKNPFDFLQKLAKDNDWTENYQFLDSAYTIPTISGFPFTLKATGSATVSLKTGGGFDVQGWNKMNIDGHIKPSAAVEIMSEMLVDAHVAHTGLKMNTNFHTSTLLDGHAVVDGGKLVSVRINMPRDKVEILDINTRFHSVFRNKARKLEMRTDNRFELQTCSDKYISTDLLGINLCADVSYARGTPDMPSCLFSGPLTARFTVEKTDVFKAFEFEYHHSNKQGIRKSTFVLDTVGSAIDRRISADYVINFENNELKAGFHTPIKSMDVSGLLDLAGGMKRAEVSLTMDGQELFGLTSSLAIEDSAVTIRYTPFVNIRASGIQLGTYTGNLIANKNKHKYTVDFAITDLFQTPVKFAGSLNKGDDTYTVVTSMKSAIVDGDMKGTFRVTGDNMLIQSQTVYSLMGSQPQTIDINSKLSKSESGDETIRRMFVDTKFSAMPGLNFQLRTERRVTSDNCQMSAILVREDRTYEVKSELEFTDRKAAGSVGFVAQHWDIDFKLGAGFDFSKKHHLMVTGEAQLNKEYFANTKVDLHFKDVDSNMHYGLKAELALPASTYAVDTGVRLEGANSHIKVTAKHQTDKEVNEVALVIALSLDSEELGGELTFSIPHFPRYELSARVVPGTNEIYKANAVAQAGQHVYTIGAELKAAQQPIELDLLFERPGGRRMSARLTAQVTGQQPGVTVDLQFGRRVTAALTGNLYPSENTGSFEIYWNKDVDDTEKASVEILLREMDVAANLKYPGREVELTGNLNANGWTADLQYAPGKVISASGNVPMDAQFFNVNINTPFEGFTTMSLTYTKKPNSEYNPMLLNYEVVGRIEQQEARLVGQTRLDQFETELKLFTPLAGWEKSLLAYHYHQTFNSFEIRVTAAKNDDQISLGGKFEMSEEEVFKIHTALELALPTDLFRKGKVGFDLKFAENSLDSTVLAQWKTRHEHELSLTLTSRHHIEPEIHIDSILTLVTPFSGFENMNSHLKIDIGGGPFKALFTFKQADNELFGIELLRKASLNFEAGLNKEEVKLDLRLPIEPRNFTLMFNVDTNLDTMTTAQRHEFGWGNKRIVLDVNMKVDRKSEGDMHTTVSGKGHLTTPFRGWEYLQVSHSSKMTASGPEMSYRGQTSYTNSEGKGIEDSLKVDVNGINFKAQRELLSDIAWIPSFNGSCRFRQSPSGVELAIVVQMHGDTARLEYSHELDDIQCSVSMSAKWFGGVTRSITTALRVAPEAVYPSIDVVYDDNKTVRIYGSITIHPLDGQSTVTLEAPFTERVVLSMSYDLIQKKFTAAYLNGEKSYSLDVDVTIKKHLGSDAKLAIKFTSPPSCMGDASLALMYELRDELKLNGMMIFYGGKFSLESELNTKKGHLAVSTPYPGYTQLSVHYIRYSENEMEIRLQREDEQILVPITQEISNDISTTVIRIKTPYSGYETMKVTITAPLYSTRMNIEYQRGTHASASVAVDFEISAAISSVSIDIQSSFEGFSTSALHFGYNMLSQEANFMLSKESKKLEVKVAALLSALSSKISFESFNTLVDLWLPEQLTMTGMYNIRDEKNSFELAFVKGEEKFMINADAQLAAKEKFITVNVATPIDGFESAKFDARLHWTLRNKLAKLEVSKNQDIFKAIFEGEVNRKIGKATIAIYTPFENYRLTRFSLEGGYLHGAPRGTDAYSKLVAERNSNKYEIKLTMEETNENSLLWVLTTPFTGFERLSFEGGRVTNDDETILQCVLTRNQDEIRAVFKTKVSWTKSKVSLEVTSPFPEARSLGVTAMYDIQSEQETCQVVMSHNDQQYGVSAFAVMRSGAATGFIEVNTPISGWENVKYQAICDLNTDEKVMEISYERNGVRTVIAGRGLYDGETAYINVITPVEGYEDMGISGHYVSRRGKREVGYDAHMNDHRHRLHVLYEREGLDNAVLKIETPIEGMHMIQVHGRKQTFPDGYGYYIDTNRDGKRNSIEIRTVGGDGSIGVDIGLKSYIEGLENVRLTGNIVTGGRKKSFSFKSRRGSNEAEISGEIVMMKKTGNGNLRVALPIEEWGDIDASFDYKLGKKNSFRLTSTRAGTTREYSGSLEYSSSSFSVTLNTPFNGYKKLSADASRTEGQDGTITASVKLMRGNRKIEITYDYKLSATIGSAHARATTPYDGFRTLQTSVDYNIGDYSRSFDFKAKRDAREWHLHTSREWEDGADSASLELTTPLEDLREMKISRAFNVKNLKYITYEAAYERNGRKFSLSGTGSIEHGGMEANFDVNVATPLQIGSLGAKIDYDFASTTRTINADLSAGERRATLTASLGQNAGSIKVVTTNEVLPQVDIAYTADIAAKKREVQASLTLYDGRKLEVGYLADYTKKNKANGHVYVQSTTYGDRKLTWDYAAPKDDFAGNLRYDSPNGNLEQSITVDGKQYVQRKVVIKSSIESAMYTSNLAATLRYNTKNGFNTKNKVVYNGKTYTLNFDAKEDEGKRKISLVYNGQRLKGVKIDGTWTLPGNPTPKKEFDIKYKRGSRKAFAKGSFQVSPGAKSGSFDIDVETPFELVKSLDVKTSWDFVLPNRVLKVNYNRNAGKAFTFNLIGSRQDDHGKSHGSYTLLLTTPPYEIMPGIHVHEYRMELEFDNRYGHMYRIALTTPVQEELKIDIKTNAADRTIEATYKYHDQLGLAPYMPPDVWVHFTSKRTERPVGPKINLRLETGFEGFEEIEANIDVTRGQPKSTVKVDYRRNDRRAEATVDVETSEAGSSFSADLQTPFEGFEQVTLTGGFSMTPIYALNLDYSRGSKYVRITTSLKNDFQRSGQVGSSSIDARFKLDSYITKRIDLLLTLESSVELPPSALGISGTYKMVATLNDDTFSLNYRINGAEPGRSTRRMVITTPFKYPFKRITYNADFSIVTNTAVVSLEYGKKKVELDASWFTGEGRQYGAEIRLKTPNKLIQAVELDAKATVHPRGNVDLLVHYRRNEKMVHVTGTAELSPFAVDLHFETPTFGNFGVKAGLTESQGSYKVDAILSIADEAKYGGSISITPTFHSSHMELGIDVYTPIPGFERLSAGFAYINVENSNVLRVVFESPMTKRMELSFEMTNLTSENATNFRAGVTTNYLGNAFTFKTSVLRDANGMKYELEIESPFHVLPSFKITGRR